MRRVVLLILLCGSVATALALLELAFSPPDVAQALDGKLSATQAKSIDLLTSLVSLFITFAVSLLGGVAYFVVSSLKGEMQLPVTTRTLLAASTTLSVLSIYFGHLVFTALIEMLANDFLLMQATFLEWPVRLQYLLLISALAIFGAAVLTAPQPSAPRGARGGVVADGLD